MSKPVGAMFVPSAISDAVQGILNLLHSDFRLDTQTRNQQIRERYAAGEWFSDLAREFGISQQRVYPIVHFKNK